VSAVDKMEVVGITSDDSDSCANWLTGVVAEYTVTAANRSTSNSRAHTYANTYAVICLRDS